MCGGYIVLLLSKLNAVLPHRQCSSIPSAELGYFRGG